jgi:hypothetical protein
MDKAKYERYAEIKKTIKALQDEEDTIKAFIMKDFKENDIDKVAFEFGKFSQASRVSYKYSDKVNTMQEKIKLAQLKEQEKGIAKQVVSHYLTYKPNKK